MDILEFSSLVSLGSLPAGFLGAATGLGGGVAIAVVFGLVLLLSIAGVVNCARCGIVQ